MGKAEKQSEAWEEQEGSFTSKLGHGRERFLAHVVEYALRSGRRTPEDFMRHFTPATIMEGLRARPSLRANILVTTTGIKFRIAVKKSAESAGEDLKIALEEGETDPATVVTLFDADDRVRHLSDKALWQFVTEDEFWTASSSDAEATKKATEHVAFILDRALQDELISHRDIIDGISVQRIAKLLPRAELEKIITAALTVGEKSKPFTEAGLVEAVGSQTLLAHVPLEDIWSSMIVPKIAEAHEFVEPPEAAKATETSEATETSGAEVKKFSPANTNQPSKRPKKSAAPKRAPKEGTVDVDVDVDLEEISEDLKAATGK
jgi:hypothetical protein